MLASAVKQVLSHEVEKQRILQSSINKSKDENERTNLSGKEKSSKPEHAPENTKTSISNLASGRSATLSSEISKPSETTKKRSSGSFNFFDRFRKTSANGSQMTETVKKVSSNIGEGFTSGVVQV
ncbi:hypothetical protein HanIR_Chr11g0541441 [Helianthus annuus]|nr:hypothetical protein HanIR_Chr11g0541441 [Helianthus annuus]